MKVIYDNRIVIKVDVNTLQPYKSKFYIEGENIVYTRDLAYIEQLSEKDYYDLDNEMDLKEVIELILNDYKLIEKYFLLGVERNDIGISLTFHEKNIIEDQIVKIIKNGVFDDEVVMTYCKKYGTRKLVNIANMEIYFKASGEHNLFEGDYKEFLSKDRFIGSGTSRAVFKLNDKYVIKVNLHSIGQAQSYNEAIICNHPDFKGYLDMLCAPLYVCKEYSIYEYCTPLSELGYYNEDVYCCELFEEENFNKFEKLVYLLEKHGVSNSDCINCSSVGMVDGKIRLLDFGGTFEALDDLEMMYNPALNIYYESLSYLNGRDMSSKEAKEGYKEILFSFIKECGINLI